jgi:hypothetical protein
MDLLMKLEPQALKARGHVHPLIGNHEAMVLLADWTYVTEEEKQAFGGADQYREAMSAEGKYGKWIRSHNAVIRINDCLFLHAGITPAFAKRNLDDINESIRADLDKPYSNGLAMDANGPLWDRTFASRPEETVTKRVDEVLKLFAAKRMIVGHTVFKEGITSRFGGKLICIDTGMTKVFGGPAACLLIDRGEYFEIRPPDVKKTFDLVPPPPSRTVQSREVGQ